MFVILRSTLRQLAKTPGFTVTALVTLAICLGANLTIFAVFDAILVRSLPFPHADQIVSIANSYPGLGIERSGASIPNYFDRRQAIKAFQSVSIYQESNVVVGDAGAPDRIPILRISPEFFATLGVPLALGQTFTDANLTYATDQVAIITDAFWRSHFNADPKVLGRTFLNDGFPNIVVGVLPANFRFLSSHAQFFRPASHAPEDRASSNRHNNGWEMIARLSPDVTLVQAQAQVDAFNAQQYSDEPFAKITKDAHYHTVVTRLHEEHVRSVKPTLVLLECGVLFLLLIGCVNLVNLLLIRASGRTRELAVRQALGARRRHIIIDVLMETTVLAIGGGLCGLVFGVIGIDLLRALGTEELPLGTSIVFDGRIAAAALAATIGISLALAAPIIWFTLTTKLALGLQMEDRGGTANRGAQRLRQGFIVAQIALAFVLLSGAGLLGISLKHVLETPVGFNPNNILTGSIELSWKNYHDKNARIAFVERLLPAIRSLPGVTRVAINTHLPFTKRESNRSNTAVTVEGYTPAAGETIRAHDLSGVTSDYWQTMGIPLLRGHLLEEADDRRVTAFCVVDQAFAERYWPNSNPLGHRLSVGPAFDKNEAVTIVGVVANVKQTELAEATGHGAVYFPYSFYNTETFTLVIHSSLPPRALIPSLQQTIFGLDPELPITDLRSLQARIDDSLVARRSPAILAGLFAAAALLLAAIGTYGVLSYAVTQRRREIGIRIALGAQANRIRNQFLWIGLRLLLVGTAFGVLGAWGTGHAMQALLFGVPALPGITLAGTLMIMSIIALAASLLPALRAAKVDPAITLRAE